MNLHPTARLTTLGMSPHRSTGRSVIAPFACIDHVHGPHITRFIQHTDTALLARAAGVA